MKKISLMAVLCCLIGISVTVFGQRQSVLRDYSDGNWSESLILGWGCSFKHTPTSDDSVAIVNGGNISTTSSFLGQSYPTTCEAGAVSLSNGVLEGTEGSSLTVARGMTVSGNGTFNNSGTVSTGSGLTVDGGTVTNNGSGIINGSMTVNGGSVTNSGEINGGLIVNGGTVTVKDGGSVEAPVLLGENGTLTIESGATVDLTDATINGTLVIEDGANVIGNYTGTLTFKQTVKGGQWNFIGLPIAADENGIGIAPLANVEGDIWAVRYDYANNQWDGNYLHWYDGKKDYIKVGEGIFAWPDQDYELTVEGSMMNGQNFTIENPVTPLDGYRWMALANPYKAQIQVAKAKTGMQGNCVYIWNGTTYTLTQNGVINSGQGFMVNLTSGNTYSFDYDNLTSPTTAKSTPAERDFLTVSVSTNGYKVPVMFAKNASASEDYDIFDANKLFGDGSVAEPYLICNDKNLCKEEVNALPYTATMNIKSGEARSIDIIAESIPEGYSLTLIDNEEEIAMNQGDVYTVNIANGENADRFKLKIGEKYMSIADVEEADNLSIRNNNRNIIIEGGKNIKAEVYNTLGQKVYETTKRNFTMEGVEAGAYVVKVQSGNAVQSRKVIIK